MQETLKIAHLPKALHESIVEEATSKFPRESGGVLVGYYASPQECFITELIGPGPDARHSRWSFDPDYGYQQKCLVDLYEASGRIHTYLGDWHTHPRGSDQLSPVDLMTLKRISTSEEARCPEPLMLLVAGGPKWRLRLWRWSKALWRHVQSAELEIR